MLVSICLIARDEEKFLPDCLESVASLVAHGHGEIILVDTGSVDRTIEIAVEHGCRVLHHAWNDDFSAARNLGIAAARGDWILCLDADERLCNPEALLRCIDSASPNAGGFLIERHDVVTDPDDGRTIVNPIGIVRAFRRHPAIRYVGSVHERPGDTILRAGLEIHTALGVKLTHLVNQLPPPRLRHKQRNYLRLLCREIDADPDNLWARYYRGKTLWYLRRLRRAADDFRCVAEAPAGKMDLRPWALDMLASLYAECGRFDDAVRCIERSLALRPNQSLAYCILGDMRYSQGDFAAAIKAYRDVRLSLDPTLPPGQVQGDLYMTVERQAYKLGCCHLAVGEHGHAFAEFRRGVQANPSDAGCYFGLAQIARAHGDRALAESLLRRCSRLDPQWQAPRRLLLGL